MKQKNTDRAALKKHELGLWKEYTSGNKKSLPELVGSLDPVIQFNVNKFTGVPLPRTALEAEARRLTINAFDTYNPNKGAGLSTHVTNHLKHLQRYVLTYQNVGKIPEHRGIAISRYQNIRDNLEQEMNRPPTTTEVSDSLGWAPAEVERMETEMRQDLSIGTGREDTSSFFDASFNTTDKTKEILHFLYYSPTTDSLTKKVMEYRFGFGGTPIILTSEIVQKLKINESQVRDIGAKIAAEVRKYEGYF